MPHNLDADRRSAAADRFAKSRPEPEAAPEAVEGPADLGPDEILQAVINGVTALSEAMPEKKDLLEQALALLQQAAAGEPPAEGQTPGEPNEAEGIAPAREEVQGA